ncbi:MAG: hypothetical protein JRJ37_07375 [Deltaproteobacteria bacterium]|nr:hypothetical protein [Deltaproteobacteria bacterium]
MPITDLKKALAYEYPGDEATYTNDDVILYHLGIGAGVPPTDSNELEYTYEKNLKVLPSFSTVVKIGPSAHLLEVFDNVPGMDINPAMILHGEQDIVRQGQGCACDPRGEYVHQGRRSPLHEPHVDFHARRGGIRRREGTAGGQRAAGS